jgi:hypothetical protein
VDSLDSETGSDSGPPRSPGLDLEAGVVRRHDRDQMDNISYKETERGSLRRSSSASSNRSRRCSGESSSLLKEIVQLASLKETINSEKRSREDLEHLIAAKLAQCRVLFDFSCDPLSDLKYKVCIDKYGSTSCRIQQYWPGVVLMRIPRISKSQCYLDFLYSFVWTTGSEKSSFTRAHWIRDN